MSHSWLGEEALLSALSSPPLTSFLRDEEGSDIPTWPVRKLKDQVVYMAYVVHSGHLSAKHGTRAIGMLRLPVAYHRGSLLVLRRNDA